MNESQSWRRRLPVLVAVGLVLAVGLLLALVGHDRLADADHDADPPRRGVFPDAKGIAAEPSTAGSPVPRQAADEAVPDDAAGTDLPPLPDSDDPDTYAEAVATVLFGMDPANHAPADYEALFAAALWDEITPEDRTRIMATIARRIPTVDMWEQMRSVEQTAEFDVELVWEPRLAREHTSRGDWPDGWTMRTVSGTQTDRWRAPGEQAQSSARPVAVTVAMACPPAASPCALIGILPHVES
ncbi:MAG: hypothetical protein ACOC9R_03550 [bacterium]